MAGAAVAAVVGLATTEYSNDKAEDRADKQIEAQEDLQKKQTAVRSNQAARARRRQLAQAQVQRSKVQNMAAGSGQGGSSAPMVAAGYASSQAGSNVTDINTQVQTQGGLESAKQSVVNAGYQAPSLGESIATNVGGAMTNQLANKSAQSLFEYDWSGKG